ncbi:pyridoxamine 5'-phosphate oxidase family protein [Fodinicola feengrottensis]|uniref:Pyridoxamine 5'-phosphate oxidase family protein n=1 Tax=Fodinicola feengrottensis TaxID=435914 RepID=A0ABN2HZL1_9ACTN|nr:pyridoxamine 5'-phosphate oxidase family protein [Fodinicola feengrottensis]
MPGPMSEQGRQDFLAAIHVGTLSVASIDERPPLAVPVFYHYEPGGDLTFFTNTHGRQSRKVGLIAKHGVLSLSVQHEELPYKYVTVEGTVTGIEQPPTAERMLAITRRYMPEEFAQSFVQQELAHPGGTVLMYTVRPDRWHSADMSEEVA